MTAPTDTELQIKLQTGTSVARQRRYVKAGWVYSIWGNLAQPQTAVKA